MTDNWVASRQINNTSCSGTAGGTHGLWWLERIYFYFGLAYEESPSSPPKPTAPAENQTSHCHWSHGWRGITRGPQPQVKKHMTTTLVLFARIWAQQARRNSRANTSFKNNFLFNVSVFGSKRELKETGDDSGAAFEFCSSFKVMPFFRSVA